MKSIPQEWRRHLRTARDVGLWLLLAASGAVGIYLVHRNDARTMSDYVVIALLVGMTALVVNVPGLFTRPTSKLEPIPVTWVWIGIRSKRVLFVCWLFLMLIGTFAAIPVVAAFIGLWWWLRRKEIVATMPPLTIWLKDGQPHNYTYGGRVDGMPKVCPRGTIVMVTGEGDYAVFHPARPLDLPKSLTPAEPTAQQ
ncbi:MAG TPA: hypothetical protein VFT64_05955 [Rickettsiales bacterium]|nr:hypothetical protein [Rickettsiales bacterium]